MSLPTFKTRRWRAFGFALAAVLVAYSAATGDEPSMLLAVGISAGIAFSHADAFQNEPGDLPDEVTER